MFFFWFFGEVSSLQLRAHQSCLAHHSLCALEGAPATNDGVTILHSFCAYIYVQRSRSSIRRGCGGASGEVQCVYMHACMCICIMCVCMYVCTHVLCVCVYVCVHVCMYVYECMCVCVCTCACMCICLSVCMYVCVCMHTCKQVRTVLVCGRRHPRSTSYAGAREENPKPLALN